MDLQLCLYTEFPIACGSTLFYAQRPLSSVDLSHLYPETAIVCRSNRNAVSRNPHHLSIDSTNLIILLYGDLLCLQHTQSFHHLWLCHAFYSKRLLACVDLVFYSTIICVTSLLYMHRPLTSVHYSPVDLETPNICGLSSLHLKILHWWNFSALNLETSVEYPSSILRDPPFIYGTPSHKKALLSLGHYLSISGDLQSFTICGDPSFDEKSSPTYEETPAPVTYLSSIVQYPNTSFKPGGHNIFGISILHIQRSQYLQNISSLYRDFQYLWTSIYRNPNIYGTSLHTQTPNISFIYRDPIFVDYPSFQLEALIIKYLLK